MKTIFKAFLLILIVTMFLTAAVQIIVTIVELTVALTPILFLIFLGYIIIMYVYGVLKKHNVK